MKRKLMCVGFIVSCLWMSTAWGVDDPVGVPWGEWRFLEAFDGAGEALADKASAPGSLIRVNAASTAITQSSGVAVIAETGPADYLRVDVDDLAENGGGGYVNEYTMVFDIKPTQADWLPIYNTGYDNYNAADLWLNADGAVGSGDYSDPGVAPLNAWARLVVVRSLEGGSWVRDIYANGLLVFDNLGSEGGDGNSSLYTNSQQDEGQFTIISDSDGTTYAGCELANFAFVASALSAEEIADLGAFNEYGIFGARATNAQKPLPENEAVDVLRDTSLAWTAGEFAGTHDVYLSDSFDDVNNASRANTMGVQLAQGQTASSIDAGRLTFGQTYYWRVDEVNATPDKTIYRGEVWQFTVEPYSVKLPFEAITASASSSNSDTSDAVMTIDGSGLDPEGELHENSTEGMWMSAPGDLSPWLMYEFDDVQKLDQMLIWNSNHPSEAAIGWGVKDIDIQISLDGVDWQSIPGVGPITRGPGFVPSEAQAIDMGLALARYIKINILTNWGGVLVQYGVAEIQFCAIPTQAREPMPADGAMDVNPGAVATWRAGREASQHTLYVGTDLDAVTDGSVPSVSLNTNDLDLTSLDLQLGETYYWRVDEVNNTEAPSVWAGPVWSLTIAELLVVDDFETYSNLSPNRPFQTWLDGIGYSVDDFFPVEYSGNGTGAAVGHDIWSVGSSHFDGSIMETTITRGLDSSQSLPFYYSNTGGAASQADRTWATPQNWGSHGIETLVLYFYGSEDNTGGSVFVTINGQKVTYPDGANLTKPTWHQWHIDLASLGINLDAVTSMSIGVEGTGSGLILIDDMLLYRNAPEVVSGLMTYGFNDLPDGDDAIEGLHGGIDFGTGSWWGGDSWYGLTKVCYFYDDFIDTDMSFTLPANAHLYSIAISADGAYSYTIGDGVNADITGTTGTTPEVINTDWASGGQTITISSSGGWNVVFDDITYKTSE